MKFQQQINITQNNAQAKAFQKQQPKGSQNKSNRPFTASQQATGNRLSSILGFLNQDQTQKLQGPREHLQKTVHAKQSLMEKKILNQTPSQERFFSRLSLKPFKIIISNGENFQLKRNSMGVSNCASENDLIYNKNDLKGLNQNDVFITRVQTLADYFSNMQKEPVEESPVNAYDDEDSQDQIETCEDDHTNQNFQDEFHKARTLLSSRIDDVRALRQIIGETKKTIQNNRRQRILNEISKSSQSKIRNPGHFFKSQNYLGGTQINTSQGRGQMTAVPKPSQSYADVIAQKYHKQSQDQTKRKKSKRSVTTAAGIYRRVNNIIQNDDSSAERSPTTTHDVMISNIIRYSQDSQKGHHMLNDDTYKDSFVKAENLSNQYSKFIIKSTKQQQQRTQPMVNDRKPILNSIYTITKDNDQQPLGIKKNLIMNPPSTASQQRQYQQQQNRFQMNSVSRYNHTLIETQQSSQRVCSQTQNYSNSNGYGGKPPMNNFRSIGTAYMNKRQSNPSSFVMNFNQTPNKISTESTFRQRFNLQ